MAEDSHRKTAEKTDAFVKKMRGKVAANHDFKKTDRIDLKAKYPNYKEESEEEKKAAVIPGVDLKKVVKKGFDEELMDKLRRFLDFVKHMFTGDEEIEEGKKPEEKK